MKKSLRPVAAAGVILALGPLSAGPLLAQSPAPSLAQSGSPESGEETPSELAKEGLDRMLRAIELMIEMIPQYDLPEVLPNGDILIRRKNPSSPDSPEDAPLTDDETST